MMNIRVQIDGGATKKMRFTSNMTVWEAIKEIQEKLEHEGEDHGIFLPHIEKICQMPKWLESNRTLEYYDLKSEDLVVYKKKHRKLKVMTLDKAEKVVMIDDSQAVQVIIDAIGQKFDVMHPEEYSLVKLDTNAWLDPRKSLPEQFVTDTETILFKKRWFVYDNDVTKEFKITLNLLYYECVLNVINGTYVVTANESVDFGAWQAQVEFGTMDVEKHKVEFLDKKLYFPEQYREKKNVKLLLRAWENLGKMKKEDAQYAYVKYARSLKDFGITLFDNLTEIDKKKKVMFGVNKSNLIVIEKKGRTDIESRVMTTMTDCNYLNGCLKMNFGQHRNVPLQLQTDKGPEIVALIRGYFDIQLKRKKDNDKKTILDNESSKKEEEFVMPTAQIDENETWVSFQEDGGQHQYEEGYLGEGSKSGATSGSGEMSGMHVGDLFSCLQAAKLLTGYLDIPFPKNPNLNLDDLKNNLLEQASKVGRAVAELLNNLEEDNGLDKASRNLLLNLKQLIDSERNASGNSDDQSLLEAGKRMANAIQEILRCAKELQDNPGNLNAKLNLRKAVEALKSASSYLKGSVNGVLVDPFSEQLLLESAKQVSESVKRLCSNVVQTNPQQFSELTQGVARNGETVYEMAQIIAPVSGDPLARQQLLNCGKIAFEDCKKLLQKINVEKLPNKNKLLAAAKQVADALQQLEAATNSVSSKASKEIENVLFAIKNIQDTSEELMESAGDKLKLTKGVNNLEFNLRDLLDSVKKAANSGLSDENLLEAANEISQKVRDLLKTSRNASDNPKNMDLFKTMSKSAQKVTELTRNALGNESKFIAYDNLRSKTKATTALLTVLSMNAKQGIPLVNDKKQQSQLFFAIKKSDVAVKHMVMQLGEANNAPRDMQAQNRFVGTVKAGVSKLEELVEESKASVPKITDMKFKGELDSYIKQAELSIKELNQALGKTKTSEEQVLEQVLRQLSLTDANLESGALDAQVENLKQTKPRTEALKDISLQQRQVQQLVAQLIEAANTNNTKQMCAIIENIGNFVEKLGNASIEVAAATTGKENQENIIAACRKVVAQVVSLVNASDSRINDRKTDILPFSNSVQEALNELINSTKGESGGVECDQAVKDVVNEIKKLKSNGVESSKSTPDLIDEINITTKLLSTQANKVSSLGRNNPEKMNEEVLELPKQLGKLIESANQMISAIAQTNPHSAKTIHDSTLDVGKHLARLISFAKIAKMDPQAEESLAIAQKNLGNSLKLLIDTISSTTPGKEDFDKSLNILNKCYEPLVPGQYSVTNMNDGIRKLEKLFDDILLCSNTHPENLGSNCLKASLALMEILNNARGHSENSKGLDHIILMNEHVGKIKTAKNPNDYLNYVKLIASGVQPIVMTMKNLSNNENDNEVKKKIQENSKDIKPALDQLLNTTKLARDEEQREKIPEDAIYLIDRLELLSSSSPKSNSVLNLLKTSKQLAESLKNLSSCGMEVAKAPRDGGAQSQLSVSTNESKSLVELLKNCAKALSVGRPEVEQSKQRIKECIGQIDAALISVKIGLLVIPSNKSHQASQEQIVTISRDILKVSSPVSEKAKGKDMLGMGQQSLEFANQIENLVSVAKEMVGTTSDQQFQTKNLELTRKLAEAAYAYIECAENLTGDPQSQKLLQVMLEKEKQLEVCGQEIIESLRGGMLGLRNCDEAIQSILKVGQDLVNLPQKSSTLYSQFRDDIVKEAKNLAGSVQSLFQTGKTAPSGVGLPSKQIAELVSKLVGITKGAIVTLEDPQLQKMLLENAKDVTVTTAKMISFAKKLAEDPSSQNQQQFAKAFKLVTSAIGGLVKNIREADTGEKDCLQAISEISKLQTDLDAATIFAETGSFSMGNQDIDLEKVKNQYLESCKLIKLESDKILKAKLNQNNLGKASLSLSKLLTSFSEQGKFISVALVDPGLQKLVLGDTKAVINKAQQLIMAAKMICGSPKDQKLNQKLDSVQESNLKEIENTSKSINEKVEVALQTQKAVDFAKNKINELLKQYATSMKGSQPSTKGVIAITKEIPLFTGKLVTSKQTDPQSLSELVKKSLPLCEKLLNECKGVLTLCPNQEIKTDIDKSATATVNSFLTLLDLMKENKMDEYTLEDAISSCNEQIADRLTDIVESIKKIPGQENLEDDLGNTVISTLERTQKLINQKGTEIKSSGVSGDTSMGLGSEEIASIVIEASRAIVSTISNLVIASIETQKELLQKGRQNVRLNVFRKDPVWAQSIIETSESVVTANDYFVEAINEIASLAEQGGDINYDTLIKKAQNLSQITQQLVAASKRKADPNSPSGKKLTLAGKSVSEATNSLLAAAKEATKRAQERVEVKSNLPFNERMRLGELGIQIKIAKYEKDLQVEQTKSKLREQALNQFNSMSNSRINPLMQN
eukprot:TRINITY_DN4387_c0_g1_i2.p1 TRINITY_DN4387_c0_g1~~TRINITY_DN4387_c0_g1_i2.p1  ORF type:complete len:2395 (+),score=901.68 TRINITY_DN4387_c0_g1_i2:60-7244(+)